MTYSFVVPGRLPGMNEMIEAAKGAGGRGIKYSVLKKRWTESIAGIVRAARIPAMNRVRLAFEWHEPAPSKTTRVRDPDNIAGGGHKVVLDGLVAAGVLKRDTMAEVAGWTDTFHVGGLVGVRVALEAAA